MTSSVSVIKTDKKCIKKQQNTKTGNIADLGFVFAYWCFIGYSLYFVGSKINSETRFAIGLVPFS